jgi:hypothetical protein
MPLCCGRFREETACAAWRYWRWRTLCAAVAPAADYQLLMQIIDYYGQRRAFVVTSTSDVLIRARPCPAAELSAGSQT